MNKIYKVIWSKVRNCYVAVSEIAKRNGKSCTSVNCGTKANRGHAGMALAVALSLSMTGGGVAWAEDVPANTIINSDKSSTVYKITAESITFTVGSAGSIQAVYNDPARNGNTITVASGGKVTGNCGSVTSGNLSDCSIGLNGSNNTVTINGRVEEGVYGGYSGADALKNTVTVNAGGYVGGFITGSRTSATYNRENAQGTVTINGGTVAGEVIGSQVYGSGTATGTVNIKGGTVGDFNKSIMGSYTTGGWYSTYSSTANGTVKIEGGTVKGNVYGAFTNEGTSDDSANSGTATGTVTITGGTMNSLVCGGTSHYGKATGSVVTISGGTINWDIRGGSSYYYNATGNTVTINAGTINAKVCGGESNYGSATGNTVSLGGVEIGGRVLGGASNNQDNTNDLVTGNKLILTKSGNSIAGAVSNFEKIEFSSTLGWTANATVLSANSFPDNATTNNNMKRATLDISSSTLGNGTTLGTMTLLKSNQADDFKTLSLIYSGGTANLSSSNQKKEIKTGTETTESSPVNGVTLKYKNVHTVSLDAANSYKNVLYTIGSNVTGITLGNMTWGTGRTVASGFDFTNVSSITANNLKFSNPDAVSGTMNLLSGATGLAAGKTVTGASHSQAFTKSLTNGVSLSSTLKGTVSTVSGAVKYTASGTTVNSVDLGSWNGTGTSAVPSGWTAKSGGVTVTTGSFTLPSLSAGQTKDILTATTANFFGTVSGARAYTSSALSSDAANGVTLAGTRYSGVKAENSGKKLTYYADTKNVTGITLGNMTWGTGRTIASGSIYTFGNVSTVTASNLKFSNPDAVSGTMNLLSGATGLAAGKTVTGASHSQAFTKSLTNGVSLSSTLKGTVSTVSGAVKYTASGTTVNNINLGSWDSSKSAAAVPTGWTLANGASVETEGMSAPSNLNPGQKKTIITADGTDYFDGIMINGSNAWSAGSDLTSNLTEGGVTIAGTQTAGGVKVNEADKSQIVYEESKKNVTSITLGEVIYAKDGIARSFDNTFDVSNADIYADNLTFTDASKALMETNDTMTIVDASGAIANSITGQKLQTFVGKTYVPIAFTDTITGKNLTFAGTHTDTLTQSDDAAKSKLIYTVGAKNVTTATLSGDITWGDNSVVYYENGEVENQNGVKPNYVFGSSSAINIGGVQFSATTDPMNKSMTLLKGVNGVVETKISGTPAFAVALTQNNTKLDAKATGSASVSGNDVIYSVNGVAIDKINVTSIENDADTVPTGWTLASGAKVLTDDLVVASPSGLEPGETKVLIKAADGATNYFNGVSVNGNYAWKVDNSTITSDLDIGGVAITGTQTKGGVKVNEANTNQIIYEESKKKINTLTLGSVTFANDDGTAATVARTFDKTYDVSTATISADGLAFANSDTMETGNLMRIVDASAAIPNAISNKKLSAFAGQTYEVAFSDTITGKNLTLKGTHTDTLSQDAAQSTLTYTVGDKKVSTATLTGDIAWNDGGTHYTNGSDANQNGTKATYKFDGNSAVDISGVAFSATSDPLAGSTKSMTLLKGVTGVVATKVSGTPSFAVTLDQTNTKLDAKATGASGVSGNDVTFTVSGVTLDKITVKSANGTADTVPTGWTLASGAKVLTDDLVVASPSGLEPGETKVLIKAADGATNYFNGVSVNGNYAWKVDNSTITSDLDIGGVAITGTQTKGGVKVNEANTNQIIYEESKKKINTLTLGSVTFANDDGTAATVARTFDKTYDVSTATISADGLAFANSDTMETGNLMRIVDASAAIPNAISNKKLSAFAGQTYEVAFSDTITGKNLTLKGTHTDTLSQDAAQSTLTYTVGDKKVSTATLTGDIAWNDGGTHYTNGSDANQNGTKATYKFDGNSAVDISGVAFSATSDPLAGSTKSMTLLKGVTGVVATKVSGTPSFAVTLDQTNTKLDAKATGASGVSGNDVTFTVSGVTLDKITVKSANGTADKVPASWTMAAGATIETDSMTVPELAAGTHVDILQSDTDGFFAKVAINGANAYGNTQETFTESDAAKSVSIAGTQDKGVTLNTEKKHLIYKAGTLDVASVTLGPAEWKKGATVFDRSGAGYNYAGVAALGTDGFAVSYASPETVATGDSMTLLQANKTLSDMAEQVKKTSYSYTPVTGVTIDANITGKLATSGGNVTYTATANQAGKLTFTNVDWKDSGALMTRPSNITFAGADVDTTKIHFKNVKELDANKKMTLVSDFGDSVGTITGTKYTVGAGLEGEGAASLSGSDLVFTTKTGARDLAAQEQTHNTLMVMEAGMAVLAAGREHLGQAMVGLADPQNAGSDGTRIGASMGGGWSRYKTGSHVDSNNWNVAVAVGSKREFQKGSLEWGVFGEYGKSNYTLHSDAGRGDGDSHYAGGGLMAKWTNKHDVYTEASVRLGRLSDTANNLLRDAAGNGYGYDVHANYFGAHVGIGKIIHYKGGKSLDVYGKYFYTKRDGVDFASGGNNYSLDSVASSILRVGARYGTTDKKWNWYGGLAYEYEFDGKSEGTVDGIGIRAASVKGGSVRGEIGLRMSATKTNPWQTDISIYGYGGKHRGFGGSVNVAYMF